MKKKVIFLFITLIVLFTGCEDSSISQVKNGVLAFNKKITVGEALDNWDNCYKRDWETFETKNGIKVVNFKCYTKPQSI
jgi:ABC-type metal ion transport system substrate-binding protein